MRPGGTAHRRECKNKMDTDSKARAAIAEMFAREIDAEILSEMKIQPFFQSKGTIQRVAVSLPALKALIVAAIQHTPGAHEGTLWAGNRVTAEEETDFLNYRQIGTYHYSAESGLELSSFAFAPGFTGIDVAESSRAILVP